MLEELRIALRPHLDVLPSKSLRRGSLPLVNRDLSLRMVVVEDDRRGMASRIGGLPLPDPSGGTLFLRVTTKTCPDLSF